MANLTGDPRGPGMPGSGGRLPIGITPEPVVIADNRGVVDLSFDSYVPSDALYVMPDDFLVVQSNASATASLTLQWRILRPDGEVIVSQETLTCFGRAGANLFKRPLTFGLLLSVSVVEAAFVPFDEFVYVSVGIFRGALASANRFQTLVGGYITFAEGISYPKTGYHEQTEGIGNQVAYNMGTPAAGADLSYTIPGQSLFQVNSIVATLTTNATVANRQVQLVIDDSANLFFLSPQGVAQAASLAWQYGFAPYPFSTLQFGAQQLIHMSNVGKLGGAVRVRTITTGLQAGDQWSLARINGEQLSYM